MELNFNIFKKKEEGEKAKPAPIGKGEFLGLSKRNQIIVFSVLIAILHLSLKNNFV